MATEKEPEKGKEMNFEFIDESEIESVKRGRKATIDAEMVAFFAKAKVGQTVKVAKLAIDSAMDADSKKKEKARIASVIRTQAKNANWKKVGIVWDTNGVPYAKRKG